MNDLRQDVRYAWRMLLKTPGFTLAVISALAVGVGANTAVFSAVNAVLLRPLPFKDPERLVWVWEKDPRADWPRNQVSFASFAAIRDQSGVFEDIGASTDLICNLTGEKPPETVIGYRFSANFFHVLGVDALLGRTFRREEDKPGQDAVAVLSYKLWQRRFGGDPAVIGRTLTVNGEPRTVIGVMPAGFQHPPFAEIWTPLVLDARVTDDRQVRILRVVGRLRRAVSLVQARTAVQGVEQRLGAEHPDSHGGWGTLVAPIRSRYTDDVRPALLALMGAVAFVLLIACANVAHLLVARAAARRREVAVRVALGASRGRLVRQLLTESVLLAFLGGGLGLLLAYWGTDLLLGLFPTGIANVAIPPRMDQIHLDGTVLLFTLGLALVTGVITGLVPAREGSRVDLGDALKEGARGEAGTRRGRRFQTALIVTEVACALVLSVGALLMVRSFLRLRQGELGFDPGHVLTLRMKLPEYKYDTAAKRSAFIEQVLARIRQTPGVEVVGETTFLPLSGWNSSRPFAIAGRPVPPRGQEPEADFRAVSDGYFRTLRIRLVKGREFTAADHEGAPRVALVNETLARRFFPGEDPVGRRVDFRLTVLGAPESDPVWREIVGVVADVRHRGLGEAPLPEIYLPYAQEPLSLVALVVRTGPRPEAMADAVRAAVWAVDRDQPVVGVMTFGRLASESVALRHVSMWLLVAFAALALGLAVLGLYAVMAYSVTGRTREIGVRIALGAERSEILRMVLRQALGATAVGVAVGLAGALALTRVLATLLHGVSSTDPATFTAIAVLMTAVALLASYVPARHAARVDPLVALRYE